MRGFTRTVLSASLLLLTTCPLRAQAPATPTGHWEGSVEGQGMDIRVEIDLATNGEGALKGTIGVPSQKLKGLPLSSVSSAGKTIRFFARSDQPFSGQIAADGTTMSGTFEIGGNAWPFLLTRTGDARIEPPLKSPAISKELEGTWAGIVRGPNSSVHLLLTMANGADGTATGQVVNLDQGGLQIPIAITSSGSELTIVPTVGTGTLSASLSATGTELVGAWKEGGVTAPFTLQRAAGSDKK